MKMRSVLYCLRQGLSNIRRNKFFSLASIGTVAACIFLISVIFTVIINVRYLEKRVEQQVGVTVFFDEGISDSDIEKIGTIIEKDSRVASYKYTSAEDAWKDFKDDYFAEDPELAEGYKKDNPLANSASYSVFLNNISDQDDFVSYMENVDGVRKVRFSSQAQNTMTNVEKFLGYVSITIIVILLGVGIFLISNTVMIGIAVRKREIRIMKLIGATNTFVRAPFVIEGVIIGLIGSIIPLTIMILIYDRLIGWIIDRFGMFARNMPFAPAGMIFSILIPLGLGIGAGIGLIGSILSIRKHLKV